MGIPLLTPEETKRLYTHGQEYMQNLVNAQISTLTPDKFSNFDAIAKKYPGISKDLIMGMVGQGLTANTPGIDKIVSLDGIAQLKNDATNLAKIDSTVKANRGVVGLIGDTVNKKLYSPLKGAIRIGFAALRAPLYDYPTTMIRDAYSIFRDEPGATANYLKDMATFGGKNTQLGSLIANHNSGTGSGFFITPESKVGKDQAKAMGAYGTVNGKSFTVGRWTANGIGVTPDTTAYNIMSGLLDASLNIAGDPSTWWGPGAVGKILTSGRTLSKLKEGVAPLTKATNQAAHNAKIAASVAYTKELEKQAKAELAKGHKRLEGSLHRADLDIATLEQEKTKVMAGTAKMVLNTTKDVYNFADDSQAAKTLSPKLVTEWFTTHPKLETGELTTGINRLTADIENTGGFFNGFILTDELPQAGKISVGAHGADEYVLTAVDSKKLKILDLANDFKKATPKQIEEESAKRAKLVDKLDEMASESRDASEMQIFGDLASSIRQASANFEGFHGSLFAVEDELVLGETLGSLIGKVAASKNPAAMQRLFDAVNDIWKVDGFGNIRSIYGELGGFAITNSKRIAASTAEVSTAAAEITTASPLNDTVQKLLVTLKNKKDAIAKRQQEYDDIISRQIKQEDQLSYIKSVRELANNDPEILKELINDPDYKGLKKILNIEVQITEQNALKELLSAEIGITNSFGGQIGKDFSKPLKFMLGRKFQQIAEIVARETEPVKIERFFGRKLDSEMVIALAAAKTSDEVLGVFLEHMGVEGIDPRNIRNSLTLGLQAQAGKLVANPLARLVDPISLAPVHFMETVTKSFNRFYVRNVTLELGDLTKLSNGVEDWISSTSFGKFLGKARQEEIINITKTALYKATTNQERAAAVEKGIGLLVEDIGKKLGLPTDDVVKLVKATKMSGKERNEHTAYSTTSAINDANPKIMKASGKVVQLTSGILEHQVLNDIVNLPDSKVIFKIINNYTLNSAFGKYRAGKILAEELGDIWRTAQLVGRVAYVWRNVAEMQMRQMFSGHSSIINHPISFIAMVMANPEGGSFRKLMARASKYQYSAMGDAFKGKDAEMEVTDGIRGFRSQMSRDHSASDWRTGISREVNKYYEVVGSEHPNFLEGFAHTINRFNSDKFAGPVVRLMRSGNEEGKLSFVQNLIDNFDSPNSVLKDFATSVFESNTGLRELLLKDPALGFVKENISAEDLFIYLFDANQGDTYAGQIKAIMGSGTQSNLVLDLIADGKGILESNGKSIQINVPYAQKNVTTLEMAQLEKEFADTLKKHVSPEDFTGSSVISLVKTTERPVGQTQITLFVNWFFDQATRFETRLNFAPEYTMAYWDYIGGYARMLNTDELETLGKNAQKSLAPFGRAGSLRVHPVIRAINKEIGRRKKNPNYVHVTGTSLHTIDQMAAKEASKYVKGLFYDAAAQNQWANAWRLVFPFAQAQYNTVNKWGELFLANPKPAIRFAKAYNGLNQEGSNVIYDATGMTYDDQQGFIYQDNPEDPKSPKKFKMPLVGSVLGALAGGGGNALQITAPVQSLNLALGQVNPYLPGVGPVMQGVFGLSRKANTFGPVNDILRDIITPFGAPQSIEDFIFPSWLKKTVIASMGNDVIGLRGAKDWASYLASSGNYGNGDNPLINDAERTRLFNDAERISTSMALIMGIFQSISPATPSQEVLAKIKNPTNKVNFMTMTMLRKSWEDISQKNPGEHNKAVRLFAEKFGAENLLITFGGTTSGSRGTTDAWTWLNNNPESADKYARSGGDVIPLFFPGGEYSLKYYNWQRQTGIRRALNPSELEHEAESRTYAMLLSTISDEQIANHYPNFWYVDQVAQLNEQFGGNKPIEFLTTGSADEKISAIELALQDPKIQQSPVYKQIAEFYPQYQKLQDILNKAKVSNYAQMTSKGGLATLIRDDLKALATKLMFENPAFSRMYYGVFAGKIEG